MNTERNSKLETRNPAIGNRQSPIANSAKRRALAGLFAEWRNYSASLDSELPERELRLEVANQVLRPQSALGKRPEAITSWSSLTVGELKRLRRWLSESSGSAADFRGALIGKFAVELWGADWSALLEARLEERFRTRRVLALSPVEARSMIEELVSRIARRDGVTVEEARKKL